MSGRVGRCLSSHGILSLEYRLGVCISTIYHHTMSKYTLTQSVLHDSITFHPTSPYGISYYKHTSKSTASKQSYPLNPPVLSNSANPPHL